MTASISADCSTVSHRDSRIYSSSTQDSSTSGMLSVNFTTPLAGQARSERLKQMASIHPAFGRSRDMQTLLVKIQTALRRMPGISSKEANEIIEELQEVGQTINQETSQLVDAVVNMSLDSEETDKAIARMSLENNLAKATTEDRDQTISNLKVELSEENDKTVRLQNEMETLMQDFAVLSSDYKALKDTKGSSKCSSPGQPGKTKALEEKIKTLEDQVHSRRSLWVMKHADPQAIARAIETLVTSVQDNPKLRSIIEALKETDAKTELKLNGHGHYEPATTPSYTLNDTPIRPPTAFQPPHRPGTALPSKFSMLQSGPPRVPSTAPFERRIGPWISNGNARAQSYGNSQFAAGSYGSAPYRNAWAAPTNQLFGGGSMEFQLPAPFTRQAPTRPPSAFATSRDTFPKTPTRNGRGKLSSFADMTSPNAAFGRPSNTGSSTGGNSTMPGPYSLVGPIVRVSEQDVSAWNERILEFYSVIRNFVEKHANMPDEQLTPDKLMATQLWDVLVRMYDPLSEQETASYLEHHLRSESSKCCLVTRIIIDYVVCRVWCLFGWMNEEDKESSIALMQLDKDFEQTTGHPSVTRQPLLDRQATLIETILKREQNGQFQKRKIEEIAGTLLTFLQPLLNRYTSASDAYRDLEEVALLAWSLSAQILTSRLTFDFRFPQIGSRFSSQSMLPIWPQMEPLELQARHWRVALVTTPVITCRNDMGSNISAHSVALADVICMQ